MRPEARAMCQVLLEHHRERCVVRAPPSADACLITYGELCGRAGVPHLTRYPGQFLQQIAEWCFENAWPPLNSLGVNAETRMPGDKYEVAPGCSLLNWPNERDACIAFRGYPDAPP